MPAAIQNSFVFLSFGLSRDSIQKYTFFADFWESLDQSCYYNLTGMFWTYKTVFVVHPPLET
jgi:hypothetical protein